MQERHVWSWLGKILWKMKPTQCSCGKYHGQKTQWPQSTESYRVGHKWSDLNNYNPGEPQPPPRVANFHQTFLQPFSNQQPQGSPLGIPEDADTEPTIVCGEAITWRRRKSKWHLTQQLGSWEQKLKSQRCDYVTWEEISKCKEEGGSSQMDGSNGRDMMWMKSAHLIAPPGGNTSPPLQHTHTPHPCDES